jgi:hypothetical protein
METFDFKMKPEKASKNSDRFRYTVAVDGVFYAMTDTLAEAMNVCFSAGAPRGVVSISWTGWHKEEIAIQSTMNGLEIGRGWIVMSNHRNQLY